MVLSNLNSPKDLYSTISASSACFRIFSMSPERTLSAVLRNAIPKETLQHALAVISVPDPRPPRKEPHTIAKKFLDDYFSGKVIPFPTAKSSIVALSRLYVRLTRFVNDYSAEALRALTSLDPFSAKSENTVSRHQGNSFEHKSTAFTASAPLSCAERIRFERAFLRHELYCRVFPLRDNERSVYRVPPLFPADFQFDEFIALITPWEAEEISCVHQYFVYLIGSLIDELEDQAVRDFLCAVGARRPPRWASTSCRGPLENLNIQEASQSYLQKLHNVALVEADTWEQSVVSMRFSCPCDSDEGLGHDRNDKKMLECDALELSGLFLFTQDGRRTAFRTFSWHASLGLDYMYNLFTATDQARGNMLMKFPLCGRDFLPEALDCSPGGRSIYTSPADVDDPANNNLGWELLGPGRNDHYKPTNQLGLENFPLRAIGYVFWDSERFRTRGGCAKLAEVQNMGFHDISLLFSRYDFRSVQERLKGVLVPSSERKRIIQKHQSGLGA